MAEKDPVIVIKKVVGGNAPFHGGSWKVALADFMTALMCFFLVMWLVSQSEETKKSVSEYFSTPSVIEYNFTTYGAELTLEKLFLDFINDPLKALQQFIEPADVNPDVMSFDNGKVLSAYMTDAVGDVAKDMSIFRGLVEFTIPDYQLFKPGTAEPTAQFVPIMNKIQHITTGLEDSTITIYSMLFYQSVADGTKETADKVAKHRLDLVSGKVESSLENDSVEIVSQTVTKKSPTMPRDGKRPSGFIHVRIKKNENVSPDTEKGPVNLPQPTPGASVDSLKQKALMGPDMTVYDQFVDQLSNEKK